MPVANEAEFQKYLSDYLSAVISRGEKVQVATGEGAAVVISAKEYNNLVETLYLNSIPGMQQHILDGRADDEPTFEVDWKNEL